MSLIIALILSGGFTPAPGSGSGGAPTDAEYWVGAANGSLSAEKNLGALGTGLVINTAGVPSAYAGSTCGAGTFATATNASGALTCSAPTNYLHIDTYNLSYTSLTAAANNMDVSFGSVIPAKARVTRIIGHVVTGFDDGAGGISATTVQCGVAAGGATLVPNASIFLTDNLVGNATAGSALNLIQSWTGTTTFTCRYFSTGGNLNTLTSGEINFYMEYVLYP